MQAQTATKKTRKTFKRKVSTRQQKIDAINFIRSQCDKKQKITDGFIKNRFGAHYVLRRLIDNSVLVRVGAPDARGLYAKSHLYTFHAGGITPSEIVDMLWELHGRTDENGEYIPREKRPAELVQASIPMTVRLATEEKLETVIDSRAEYNRIWRQNNPEKMKEYNDRVMAKRKAEKAESKADEITSHAEKPALLNAVSYVTYGTLAENIDEWLRMCDQFKIQARGQFIFAQLQTMGYVK